MANISNKLNITLIHFTKIFTTTNYYKMLSSYITKQEIYDCNDEYPEYYMQKYGYNYDGYKNGYLDYDYPLSLNCYHNNYRSGYGSGYESPALVAYTIV